MKEIKSTSDFTAILNQNRPVLVDFYADWCGPCQTLLPIVDDLAETHKDDFEIVKVNVDHNPELAGQFKVRSIPALFFLKEGSVVESLVGLQQKSVLNDKIEALKAA